MHRWKVLPDLDLNMVSFKENRSTLLSHIRYYRSGYRVMNMASKKIMAVYKKPEVSVSERYTLSVEEAAVYYGIGQKRLRYLIADDPTADYLIAVGNRTRFKRRKFEEYLDNATCI